MPIQDQRSPAVAAAPPPAGSESRQCPYCTTESGSDVTELSLAAAELGLLTQFFGLAERIPERQS